MRKILPVLFLLTFSITNLIAGEFRFDEVALRVFCSDEWEVSKSPRRTEFSYEEKKLSIVFEISSAETITGKEKMAKDILSSQFESFEISVNYSRKINDLPSYNIEGNGMKEGKMIYFHICFIDNNNQTLVIIGTYPREVSELNKDSMRDFLNNIRLF